MEELITQEQFAAGLRVVLAVSFVGCWVVGVIAGWRQGAVGRGAIVGGLLSLLCPVVYGLWLLYAYLVRYNPVTGEAGLHKVSIFLLNLLIFAVVGGGIGLLAARISRRLRATGATTPPSHGA